MKRKYDKNLVDTLQNTVQEVEYEGLPVQVKPIPEGGADGDMDPRVYKSMKKNAVDDETDAKKQEAQNHSGNRFPPAQNVQ